VAETNSDPVAVGVMLTEQLALAAVGVANVHGPPGLNVIVPVGAMALAVDVSDTVAVHDVVTPMATVDGVQLTVTVVGLSVTVIMNGLVVLLMACNASPL